MKKINGRCNKLLMLTGVTLFLIGFLTSCTTERIAYFKDIPDTLSKVKSYELSSFASPVVQSDDILNITIQTLDPSANAILNQGNLPVLSGAPAASAGTVSQQNVIAGYLVNKQGNVHLPYAGDVHVAGFTTDVIRDTVLNRIAVYFQNPVVNVRFANFKITVLGEVKNPATFVVPNEKPTVIDALGLAGDITIYGRHDNVLLMRDNNGHKEVTRLNLDSSKSISSPYFYLRPNDVLYVEPTGSRVESTNAYRVRDIALIAAGLSLLTIIFARVIK